MRANTVIFRTARHGPLMSDLTEAARAARIIAIDYACSRDSRFISPIGWGVERW